MTIEQNYKTVMNNNGQKTIIGNYNDNEIVVKKCFQHLNNYKRSRSLMNQSIDETQKMKNELNMYHEIDNLELALRTLQNNIRREKYDNNNNE